MLVNAASTYGYSFHWAAYSHEPYMVAPDGKLIRLFVRHYVPYIRRDSITGEYVEVSKTKALSHKKKPRQHSTTTKTTTATPTVTPTIPTNTDDESTTATETSTTPLAVVHKGM